MLSLLPRALTNFSAWNTSTMEMDQKHIAGTWCTDGDYTLKIGIITTLGCLIILGNLFVLLVIASSVSGWSRNSRYILISLTGTDVTLALVVVPLNLYGSLVLEPGDEDAADSALGSYCHIVAFLNSTVFASSIYSLSTISLERYVAVFFPLQYNTVMSRRRVKLLIAASWLLPPVFLFPISIPGGTVIHVYFSRASLICNPDYSSNMAYSLLLTTVIFFPCSVIVTFANLRLWRVARMQSRRMSMCCSGRNRQSVTTVCEQVDGSKPVHLSKGRHVTNEMGERGPRRGDAASRVLIPVVCVFYICWAPCMVTILYNAITHKRVPEWVEFAALWLPSGNGFLNCFVYFWINKSFRHKFRQLGRKLCPWGGCWTHRKSRKKAPCIKVTNNNAMIILQERSCSMSSTCMLLPQTADSVL
ncbi:PREDICTED: probable G-protein coupled receptor 21 [Nanorana parkeri]|uniref:probable G-protein coupled receptor 21 n=1 Tax=Nanorana parkeri TaxID=125878 RepID=UPI0008544F1A|nr:PREDICTED: probable G-protein coupled receptor 21 [Nanorana parkeri]